MEPKYYGQSLDDLIQAMKDARDHGQIVLMSMAPKQGLRGAFGFWTDAPDAMIRSFEEVIYRGAKRHSDKDIETLAKRWKTHHPYWE